MLLCFLIASSYGNFCCIIFCQFALLISSCGTLGSFLALVSLLKELLMQLSAILAYTYDIRFLGGSFYLAFTPLAEQINLTKWRATLAMSDKSL